MKPTKAGIRMDVAIARAMGLKVVPDLSTSRLMETNFAVTLNCNHESSWSCGVNPPSGDERWVHDVPTAPLAICRVALEEVVL